MAKGFVLRAQNNISLENDYLCKKSRGKRDENLKNSDFVKSVLRVNTKLVKTSSVTVQAK